MSRDRDGTAHALPRPVRLALLFVLTIPTTAFAETRSMTLPDAVKYAREHHPEARAALARVAAQQATARIPWGQWYPSLAITAQLLAASENNTTASYVGVRGIDIPRIGGTRVSPPGTMEPAASTFAAVGVRQEIFDFGRIAAQAAAEDALVDVEKERTRGRLLDVEYSVEEAYFAVLATKEIVKASDDAFDRARVHRDLAKAGVDAGLRPPIELTRADAELAKLDIARVRARGNVTNAQTIFAASVGFEEPMLDANGSPSTSDVPSLADALQSAANRDPLLKQAQAQLHAEEQRTRAIGAELRPDFWLTTTFSGRAGGAPPSSGPSAELGGWVPYVPNWDVGIVFSWPLFDGVTLARKNASRAREQVRREEIASVRQLEGAVVRRAWVAVDIAKSALPALERAVTAAEANYAQAEARFKSGLGTSIELADAENVRTDAEIQLALGKFDLARTRAVLGRAMAENP